MSIKQTLAGLPILRHGVIKALKLFSRDIAISNSWTGHRLKINTYRHKTYWYYGREREEETMQFFSRQVHQGNSVIEVGGHIGFVAQYFSMLVGPNGRVIVFEPGSNNRRYIEENVRRLPNITLEFAAVSSKNGKSTFFEDNVTGQNNSLLSDYKNADWVAASHGDRVVRTPHEVDLVTLDSYVSEYGLTPDFLKIDVEGCELDVLLGAHATLGRVHSLMVEVTEQHKEVASLLHEAGFNLFDKHGNPLSVTCPSGNVFALR